MFLSARRRQHQQTIDRLYGAIVAQAREPAFYATLGVPDTVEGRFDLLVLHVHLLFRRLAGSDEEARTVGQAVFDRFLADLDASLREMGIGDLAVPKRMKAMGEAFYGRASAYDTALAHQDNKALIAVLRRNVYGDGSAADAVRLADYVRRAATLLGTQHAAAIVAGQIDFPLPAELQTG